MEFITLGDFKSEISEGFIYDIVYPEKIDYHFRSYIREYFHRYRYLFEYPFEYVFNESNDEYIELEFSLPNNRLLYLKFSFSEIVEKKTQNVYYRYTLIENTYDVEGHTHLYTILNYVNKLERLLEHSGVLTPRYLIDTENAISIIADLKEKTKASL